MVKYNRKYFSISYRNGDIMQLTTNQFTYTMSSKPMDLTLGEGIGIAAICLLVLWLLVIFIRALRFRPNSGPEVSAEKVEVNREKVIADMQAMIRCKTISYADEELTDFGEFEKFHRLLEECYPLIHKKAIRTFHGRTGIVFCLPGSGLVQSAAPIVLMAHYDVVPVNEADWEKPAFEGILEKEVLWGRGTLDTKGTVCGILEAVELLLSRGYMLKQDLYLAFSGDEEVNGQSCPAIVAWLEGQGIHPAMVLDEGGAVVENVFPGVKEACAMVGIAEKGFVNLELSLKSPGGHASTPPAHTIVGKLAQVMVAIEKKPFPARLSQPARQLFDTLGRHSSFGYKLIFANLWCFTPLLNAFCRIKGGELNAMMRTTCALTKMEGSKAFNVLPPSASIGLNLRLLSGDTVDTVLAYLKKVIKMNGMEYRIESAMNPSPCSDTDCEAWENLKKAISATWPQAIVSPYMMLACSDSRHYCRITDKVYRFSPMRLTKEEREMIHGNNERIPVDTLVKTVEFYVHLLQSIS